jgi:glycine cleavage system H protein
MEVIEDYFYTKEHEWVRIDDNIATVGISEYAQSALGDITFVELPEEGLEVEQFEQFASVESVKAASDIYCPMSGTVIEVNEELDSSPDLVNRDCYEKGWLVKIEISNLEDKANLMTSVEYQKFLESLE